MIEYTRFDGSFDIAGKTAVVTGGAKGIGKAICQVFAQIGVNVIILDIAEEDGLATIRELKEQFNVDADFFLTDLGSKTSIAESTAKVESTNNVDILVNNAGVGILNKAEDLLEEEWDKTLSVNAKGVFFASQSFGRRMIERRKGKIINIASQAGVVAIDLHAAYCASKAAVISLTKTLALEWAKYGINVNAVSPTVVLTEMGEKAWGGKEGEALKRLIPNGRFAYPDEIAAATVFLASDASAMINGENIVIDGGYTIH